MFGFANALLLLLLAAACLDFVPVLRRRLSPTAWWAEERPLFCARGAAVRQRYGTAAFLLGVMVYEFIVVFNNSMARENWPWLQTRVSPVLDWVMYLCFWCKILLGTRYSGRSLLCAGALVLGAAGCSKSADSSSAASSTAAAVYGSAEDYDYENFSYSSGLDENGYWEGVKALDYVTLPENFASLTFKRSEIEPTEEELQSEIDSLLSDHSTEKQVTDRAAADGDTVNIDYAGSVDGVAFSGGTYSGYSLTLGSGTFVDGFEDQIVGHTPGETFDVTVTFPEGYSDSTDSEGNTVVLSGKKAVFSVTLNYISEKVLPELTDAWVAENYGESDDVHTVEELKAPSTPSGNEGGEGNPSDGQTGTTNDGQPSGDANANAGDKTDGSTAADEQTDDNGTKDSGKDDASKPTAKPSTTSGTHGYHRSSTAYRGVPQTGDAATDALLAVGALAIVSGGAAALARARVKRSRTK